MWLLVIANMFGVLHTGPFDHGDQLILLILEVILLGTCIKHKQNKRKYLNKFGCVKNMVI